jgi:molybdopterin synthase catalytic subunit
VSIFPPLAGGAAIRLIAVNGEAIDIARLQQIVADPAAGAVVTFTGVVRSNSMKQGQRKDVAYLEYEAYGGMAEAELSKIAQDMIERWDLCAVAIHHRIGERLDIGVASVGIAVSAPHRQDAFAACAYCMDRIKETVPIWKKEYAKDGEWWVEGPQQH